MAASLAAPDPLAPASALSARRRSTTQSLSGARHAARDAPRSTSFPSIKPRSSLRDQIGIRHTGPLKQALTVLALPLARKLIAFQTQAVRFHEALPVRNALEVGDPAFLIGRGRIGPFRVAL